MLTPRISSAELHRAAGTFGLIVALASAVAIRASGQTAADPKARIDPGLAFTMLADSDRRITLPRLTEFPDSSVLQQVNADLDAESASAPGPSPPV